MTSKVDRTFERFTFTEGHRKSAVERITSPRLVHHFYSGRRGDVVVVLRYHECTPLTHRHNYGLHSRFNEFSCL